MSTEKYIRCRFLYAKTGINDKNNKVQIAVCDENAAAMENTKKVIKWCLAELKIEAAIEGFLQHADLLETVKNFDLIFLAVKMPETDGFQMVKDLRKAGRSGRIIFYTKYPEYMQEAFEVQPYRYLLKSDSREKMQEAIKSAMQEDEARKGIVMEEDGKVFYILLKDILYVETLGDDLAIAVKEREYIMRMSLKKISSILGSDFIQCNRGMFVNARHISKVQEMKVVLDNGKEVGMSVRERKDVWKRYQEYVDRNNS